MDDAQFVGLCCQSPAPWYCDCLTATQDDPETYRAGSWAKPSLWTPLGETMRLILFLSVEGQNRDSPNQRQHQWSKMRSSELAGFVCKKAPTAQVPDAATDGGTLVQDCNLEKVCVRGLVIVGLSISEMS
ncbi:hypothetical protein NX059_000308 [Plenodomus lindquistii]|nr:hypothetical protein NX059_000308 [Plenodomus lindquistii]